MKTESKIARLAGKIQFGTLLAFSIFAAHSGSAATEQWQGIPSASATTNWTDVANWTSPQQTYYNQVQFTGTGANANNVYSVNNVFDSATGVAQMPIWELDFIPLNGNYTTLINPGVTLNLDAGRGYLYVGADALNTASPALANAVETITIQGAGGTLSMVGNLYVNQGSVLPGDTHNVTLDLSGLDTFTDSGPEILVASGSAQRSHGTLYLARTNQITLGNDFQLCNQVYSNSVPCAVYLGQANTVTLGTGNLIVGGTGTTAVGAWMKFNPAFIGGPNPPNATFNSSGSNGRIVNFWICNANGAPNVPGYGLCDFSGGSISMLVDTMQLGQAGTAAALGILTFDDGVVDVNNATVGNQEVGNGGTGVGIINLNTNSALGTKATLQVNNTLTLAAAAGGLTTGTAGTININGGTLSANTIVNGAGTGTINATNGTLSVTGVAGTLAAPLSSLSVTNSILNLSVISGTNSVVATSLRTGGAANVINIASAPPFPSYPVQITLVKYTGSIGGAGYNFTLGTLPALYAGHLSNNVANASIDLVLTSGSGTLTWKGNVNGNWDTTTANWLAGGSTTYANGQFVQFLDGASIGTVNLTAVLLPGSTVVSNTVLSYTFNGTGSLGGSGSLVKAGAGTLVIDNGGANNFSGGVGITGGTLQVGNNDSAGSLPSGAIADNGNLAFARSDSVTVGNSISGTGSFTQAGTGGTLLLSGANSFSGNVIVTNGSTLQIGNSSALGSAGGSVVVANGSTFDINGYPSTKPIIVSGSGVGGNGALTDNGGAVYGPAFSITLTGDTTFNYPNRWDLDTGSTLGTGGNAYNLTLVSSGYFEWRNATLDSALGNINLASGSFGVVGSTTLGNPASTLTLEPGAALVFYGGPYSRVNKQVDFQSGAAIDNYGGDNIMNGTMTLEPGFCLFNISGGTSLTISNVLSGSGAFYANGGSGTVVLSGNSPSFSGGVSLYTGKLVLNGTIGSGIAGLAGTTVAGSGTASGLVDVGTALLPGDDGLAGIFHAQGGLVLESGATLTEDLSTTIVGNNDLVAVTGDLTVNGNTIVLNPTGGTLQNGVYPLLTYTGNLTGSFGGVQTISPSIYTLTLTNITTTSPKQIGVVVSGNPSVLLWNNGANNGEWDFSSLNWSNVVAHAAELFANADSVIFDDSILSAAIPGTNIDIANSQIVSPAVITNNSTVNYTISGAGKISGATKIVKTGSSTLKINTVNDFAGNTTIAGGAVQVNNISALGNTSGTIYVTNGATFLVNLTGGYPAGDSGFGAKPIVISGTGAGGNGAIQINGNPIYNDSSTLGLGRSVTLAGNAAIGGTARWDFGFPGLTSVLSSGGSNYNFTIIESGYSQWRNVTIDSNLGNMDIYSTASSQQTWVMTGMGGGLGNPTNVLTLHTNILLSIQHGDTAISDSGYAKVIHVQPTAAFAFQPSGGAGDYHLDTALVLDDGSAMNFFNGNGGTGSGTTLRKPVTLNGLVHLQIGDSTVTFSNVISGPGGFYWDNYNNTVAFVATNTYLGVTDLRSGRTLALVGKGSISSSTNIMLTGATVDVSQRTDQTLTLALGQTLQGNGTITGNLTVGAGATVSPGGAGVIGTLTVSSSVILSGTTAMDLNKTAGTRDQITSSGNINYGGTLSVNNLAGTLTASDSFKLFNGATYAGSFASIVPATPGAGLAWDTSSLTSSGTLKIVASAGVAPTIKNIFISGGNVVISGTNNAGSGGTYHVLGSTNLALPLASWTVLTNGTFGGNGNFSFTNTVGGNPRQFYLLQVP